MKTTLQIYLMIIGLYLPLLSCKETEEPLQILPPVPGGDWVIYQWPKSMQRTYPYRTKVFQGLKGDVAIRLERITGDTLIFIISIVGERPAQLKVTMGNQIRTWLFKSPIPLLFLPVSHEFEYPP